MWLGLVALTPSHDQQAGRGGQAGRPLPFPFPSPWHVRPGDAWGHAGTWSRQASRQARRQAKAFDQATRKDAFQRDLGLPCLSPAIPYPLPENLKFRLFGMAYRVFFDVFSGVGKTGRSAMQQSERFHGLKPDLTRCQLGKSRPDFRSWERPIRQKSPLYCMRGVYMWIYPPYMQASTYVLPTDYRSRPSGLFFDIVSTKRGLPAGLWSGAPDDASI